MRAMNLTGSSIRAGSASAASSARDKCSRPVTLPILAEGMRRKRMTSTPAFSV